MGDQQEGSKDQRLDGFFDAEQEGRIFPHPCATRPEINGDGSREHDREQTDEGEHIHLAIFEVVPDSITDGNCQSDKHGPHRPDMPKLVAFLAQVAENEDGYQDIDGDIDKGVFLSCGSLAGDRRAGLLAKLAWCIFRHREWDSI